MKKIIMLLMLAFFTTSPLLAEDIAALMKKVQDYADAGNYSKAIEELGWVRKELEKGNAAKVQTFFPDEVAGFKGGQVKSNDVMGMANTERTYSKDAKTVNVHLTSGSGTGPLGGLAEIGKMAAMFGGQQPGVDSFRINGRTAQLNAQGKKTDLTVFLDSGSILKFEGAEANDLKAMAEGFAIEQLDNYLRGQG